MTSIYKKVSIGISTGGGGSGTFEFFFGTGVPSAGLGVNGDVYLDTITSNLYKKVTGAWVLQTSVQGIQGVPGPTGAPGSQILSGAGAPAGGLGVNTDFYINSTNGDYYLKAAGVWNLQGNLKGPIGLTGATGSPGAAGAAGTVWRDGSGLPSNSLGVNGDFYLNTATGSYYLKVTGVYVFQGSLAYATPNSNIDGGLAVTIFGGTTPVTGGDATSF